MSYHYRRNERLVFRTCAALVVMGLLLAICANKAPMYHSAWSAVMG